MASEKMRIGYVDYQLDNFHANHYLKLLRGELADSGFEVVGCKAMQEEEGKAWSAANNVPYFDSYQQLADAVDVFMVLAPSNTETHLELCQAVLPFGKTTYVDKTFAPDHATAVKIFSIAEEAGTAMQTTSALRYTNIQAEVEKFVQENLKHMVVWGGGGTFEEYAIHPVELMVSCMGIEVERIMRRGTDPQSQLLIDFSGGRTSVINVYTEAETPFAASLTTGKATQILPVDNDFFRDFTKAQLDFFRTGKSTIPKEESLMVRRILDAAEKPEALEGFIKI